MTQITKDGKLFIASRKMLCWWSSLELLSRHVHRQKNATKKSGYQSRSRQRAGQVEQSTGLSRLESHTQFQKQFNKRRTTGQCVHLALLMDVCHLKHSERATHLHTQVQSRAPGSNVKKTTEDTEQCSRSKEHHLRMWQQQDSWIQNPGS